MLPLLCCYFGRAGTNNIVVYNLQTERELKQIRLGGSPRKNSYQWGGYSGVDLAVDEQGLWVLWGHTLNNYRLNAYKMDVYRGRTSHVYNLGSGNTPKSSALSKNIMKNSITEKKLDSFVRCIENFPNLFL